MNKLKSTVLIITASLFGTATAFASPLFLDVAHQMDMGATHINSPHSAIAAADMARSTGGTGGTHNLLGLVRAPNPDIAAHFLTSSYDSALQALTVDGFAFAYDNGGVAPIDLFANFSLSAVVDNSGGFISGNFSVSDLGGTLLSGTLLDLGYDSANGGTLELLFAVVDGDYALDFGGIGALGSMIMTQTGFGGFWNANWSGDNTGVVDIAALATVVPEPGILVLAGLGLSLIAISRRRKI